MWNLKNFLQVYKTAVSFVFCLFSRTVLESINVNRLEVCRSTPPVISKPSRFSSTSFLAEVAKLRSFYAKWRKMDTSFVLQDDMSKISSLKLQKGITGIFCFHSNKTLQAAIWMGPTLELFRKTRIVGVALHQLLRLLQERGLKKAPTMCTICNFAIDRCSINSECKYSKTTINPAVACRNQ